MELDITAFGSGCGLVLLGWICGMGLSYIFSILVAIGRLK